jgi:hypothetical protein
MKYKKDRIKKLSRDNQIPGRSPREAITEPIEVHIHSGCTQVADVCPETKRHIEAVLDRVDAMEWLNGPEAKKKVGK